MYKHMYMHCLHMKIFEFMTICAENLRIEMITVGFFYPIWGQSEFPQNFPELPEKFNNPKFRKKKL